MLTIYDCDGTLIDSERPVAAICLRAIHALGLTTWTLERYYRTFVGMPYHVGWGAVATELGRPLPEGFNADINRQIEHAMQTELKAVDQAREAILSVPDARCVASSTGQPALSRNLGFAGLLDLFPSAVFSASQVARGKPAPDVFLLAAAMMGTDPAHTVVIEDSVPGVLAARRAGMAAIGFVGTAHDQTSMAKRLLEAGASVIVDHLSKLPVEIERMRDKN